MVILDTNIIIDHLRQSKKKKTILTGLVEKFSREELAISVISIQELFEGQSTKEEERESDLLETISSLKIFPYTFEVAKLAGEIARDFDREIDIADAAIAATAIIKGAQLATLNKKDFSGIKDLEFGELAFGEDWE